MLATEGVVAKFILVTKQVAIGKYRIESTIHRQIIIAGIVLFSRWLEARWADEPDVSVEMCSRK